LFDITRLSDQTTQTFNAMPTGQPVMAAIQAFLNNDVGYVTKIYDQSGNGNHVSQTVLASAPYIDLTRRFGGGCPPIVADWSRRSYSAGQGPFIGTATSNVIAVTGSTRFVGPLPQGLAPGMTITGANIPANDTITAINYTKNTLTLSAAPTAALSYSLPAGTKLTWAVSSSGTTEFTFIGAPPTWLAPGLYVTGTGIPTNDQVASVVYVKATNISTVALVAPPNATPGNLVFSSTFTITAPKVFMDLPATVSVPYDNHSLFTVMRAGGIPRIVPVTFGASAETASGSLTFDQLVVSGISLVSSFRVNAPPSYYYNIPITTYYAKGAEDMYGFTRSGKTVAWYGEESTGSISNLRDPGTAPLTGGSLFYTQQFPCDDDEEMYASIIYPTAITAAQENTLKSAMNIRFGINPQIKNTIIFDGSSTTAGNGTDLIDNTAHMTGDSVAFAYPNRPLVFAASTSIEGEAYLLPKLTSIETGMLGFNAANENIIVYHPGLGNSIMADFTVPISQQNGNVLTISPTQPNGTPVIGSGEPINTGLLPGLYVTGTDANGNTVIPANTKIVAVTSNWIGNKTPPYTMTLSNAPTGTVAKIENLPETGANAWANIQTYIANANVAGFKVVLIGSAPRWFFESNFPLAPTWLQEFHNAKALMANGWKAAGAVGYIDLETNSNFGADWISGTSGTVTSMNVTNVNAPAKQVTVSQLTKYIGVGNYVTWPGMMPPAAYITGITGNTLTLSQTPPSSLTAISDLDPIPWVHAYPYWNLDGQHFTYLGYRVISSLTANVLLNNGVLNYNNAQ
jgi:hypothetical protein